jgi:hypothetical protein
VLARSRSSRATGPIRAAFVEVTFEHSFCRGTIEQMDTWGKAIQPKTTVYTAGVTREDWQQAGLGPAGLGGW